MLSVEEAARPLLERLDPQRRTAVVLLLVGIALIGVLLVVCVMIGGSWLRRQARREVRRSAWNAAVENQRLRTALSDVLPDVSSSDTLHANRGTDETHVDP